MIHALINGEKRNVQIAIARRHLDRQKHSLAVVFDELSHTQKPKGYNFTWLSIRSGSIRTAAAILSDGT